MIIVRLDFIIITSRFYHASVAVRIYRRLLAFMLITEIITWNIIFIHLIIEFHRVIYTETDNKRHNDNRYLLIRCGTGKKEEQVA